MDDKGGGDYFDADAVIYFDIIDGDEVALDEEGLDFPDIGYAQVEAAESLVG